jgi:hypothetical protein
MKLGPPARLASPIYRTRDREKTWNKGYNKKKKIECLMRGEMSANNHIYCFLIILPENTFPVWYDKAMFAQ